MNILATFGRKYAMAGPFVMLVLFFVPWPGSAQEHTLEGSGSSQSVEAMIEKARDIKPGFSREKENLYRRIADKAGSSSEPGQRALVALANIYDEQLAELRTQPLNPSTRSKIDSAEAAMDEVCSKYLGARPPSIGAGGEPITEERMMAWRCLAARQSRGDFAGLAALLSLFLDPLPEWGPDLAPLALKLGLCKLILGDLRGGETVLRKAVAGAGSNNPGHHAELMNDLLADLKRIFLMEPDEARSFVTETYLRAPAGTFTEPLVLEWARTFMVSGFSGTNGSGR